LAPTAILFADGDGDNERRKMWVNSVQIRAGALSQAELGTPSASGIPVAVVLPSAAGSPRLTIVRLGNDLRLSWPANVTGYRLECTSSLSNPDWQEVASVANCATVPISGIARFYRLISP
jgi:hypothetical protein